jgi:hypothetical protein
MFMSPEVRHLLEQSERAFRLAREMTNRADEARLEQTGRYFLAEARRVAEEEHRSIVRPLMARDGVQPEGVRECARAARRRV